MREGATARFGARETLLGAALVLIGVPFGLLLHQVAIDGPLTRLDDRVARWLHDRLTDNDAAIAAMRAVSFTGSTVWLTTAILVPTIWLVMRRSRKLALFLVVVAAGGAIVNSLVKLAVGRARPEFDEPIATAFGNSFPSGHSMSSLICYGALLVVFLPLVAVRWRRLVVVATGVWVALIGFSRLALGVHFVADVLGGFVLGAAWLTGSVALFEIWREERGRRPTEPLSEGVEPELADDAEAGIAPP